MEIFQLAIVQHILVEITVHEVPFYCVFLQLLSCFSISQYKYLIYYIQTLWIMVLSSVWSEKGQLGPTKETSVPFLSVCLKKTSGERKREESQGGCKAGPWLVCEQMLLVSCL